MKGKGMPTPWDAAIRTSRQLTVFPGPDLMKSPAWGAVLFKKVIDEFNKLSSVHKLGVTLISSNTAPTPQGNGGANVQIEVSPGKHSFIVDGIEHKGSLPVGLDIIGRAHVVIQGGEIRRVYIFVPIDPKISGPNSRGIGIGVKTALTLHEVIHACGLNESDPGHSTGLNNPDLFMTNAQFEGNFPPDGNPGDRFSLGFGRFVPPFFLTARTAGLIIGNWS